MSAKILGEFFQSIEAMSPIARCRLIASLLSHINFVHETGHNESSFNAMAIVEKWKNDEPL